jgi:hypothetical protein
MMLKVGLEITNECLKRLKKRKKLKKIKRLKKLNGKNEKLRNKIILIFSKEQCILLRQN